MSLNIINGGSMKFALSMLLSLFCVGAYADVFTATGHAQGYVCSEGSSADCDHAGQAASDEAMQQCYDAGKQSCVVTYVSDTDYGGACGPDEQDDYCDASASVTGN